MSTHDSAPEVDVEAGDPAGGGGGGDGSGGGETRTRRSRFGPSSLPHEYRENGLEWTIESCTLTDDRDVVVEEEAGRQYVSLLPEQGWETVTFTGSITIPDGVYEAVVDAAERRELTEPPTKLSMIIHCEEAILRTAEVIEAPAGPGEHTFEVELQREEIYGTVKLTPSIVRRTTFDGDGGGCATEVGAHLADGVTSSIAVDLTSDTRGLLHPKRRKFSEDESLPPTDHLVHLQVEGENAPQLYLNDDHERVVDILDTHVNVGYNARMRDLAFDALESQLWPQLITLTAASVSPTGEVNEDWQEDVLRKVRGSIYDESLTMPEVGHELRSDIRDAESTARLQRDIEDFVQSDTEVDVPGDVEAILKLLQNRNNT